MIWLLLVILAILVLLEMPIAFALPTSAFLYLLIAGLIGFGAVIIKLLFF